MRFLLAALAYGALTTVLFGNPVQPILLATIWSDRLGIPYWRVIVGLCIAASALVFAKPFRDTFTRVQRPSIFVILAVLVPTVIVGGAAEVMKARALAALGADEIKEQHLFLSIRNAPADTQFFLHTAALKGCTAYAWSYREMGFYVLRPDTAVNVLPRPWIDRCGIQIERR